MVPQSVFVGPSFVDLRGGGPLRKATGLVRVFLGLIVLQTSNNTTIIHPSSYHHPTIIHPSSIHPSGFFPPKKGPIAFRMWRSLCGGPQYHGPWKVGPSRTLRHGLRAFPNLSLQQLKLQLRPSRPSERLPGTPSVPGEVKNQTL